jgi:hypothetical protein
LALGFAAIFLTSAFLWPFRLDAVTQELADESDSKVTVGSFHATYFPIPGCVLERVVFRHNPKSGAPPLITIRRMTIRGSFAEIFAKHVTLVLAEGMQILVPPLGSEHFKTPPRSSVVIDDLVADGAILEVASRQPGTLPLQFAFRRFNISHIGGSGQASFNATLSNPEPPGEITTTGKFGPWNAADVGQTAVSGQYRFENANLGVFPGISGILASSGKYAGTLGRLQVEGNTDVPLFGVKRSSHQTKLETQFRALVNAENGDVSLQNVNANFRHTNISTQGSVAGEGGHPGKTANLTMVSQDGKIQDLLLLFIKSPRAPMSGTIGFQASALLPPGKNPFLERVELQGDFGIDAGRFSNSDTQEGVNSLSRGARKDKSHANEDDDTDPRNVLSDLKGHVLVKHGIATFSNLSFGVPGALARVHGSYNLITEKIDLHGTLRTQDEVSGTTHGIKALMLKVLDPFFRHKPNGYLAPVKITGTYDHPAFGLDLGNQGVSRQNPKGHRRGISDQDRQ